MFGAVREQQPTAERAGLKPQRPWEQVKERPGDVCVSGSQWRRRELWWWIGGRTLTLHARDITTSRIELFAHCE